MDLRLCRLLAVPWALGCGDPRSDRAPVEDDGTEPAWVASSDWLGGPPRAPIRVVDVRSAEAFAEAHVPGAVHLPWTRLLEDRGGVPGLVAPPEVVEDALRSVGLQEGERVVAYDDRDGRDAGRTLWTLAYHGIEGGLLLDGCLDRWEADGRPTASGDAPVAPSDLRLGAVRPDRKAEAEEIIEHLDDPDWVLLDVRTAEEYREGHLPGALHVDWTDNLEGPGPREGMLKEQDVLRQMYAGIGRDKTVVVYCRTGARAGLPWVVLPWLGFVDVRLYDGSWAEWSTLPDAPVNTGVAP